MSLASATPGMGVRPVPGLGVIAPWMLTAAFIAHLLVLLFYFASRPAEESVAGGGGKILGQMSMTLAGAAERNAVAEAEETATEPLKDPVAEPEVTPSVPPVQTKPRPVRQTPPRQTAPPVPRRQTTAQTTPSSAKPAEHSPAPAAQAASPTIGKGAAAPVPGVGSGTSTSKASEANEAYLSLIRQRIEENRRYPAAARRRGIEGTTVLTIVIDANGQVSQVSVSGRSGSFNLDRAAKRMVSAAAPFPPPPSVPYSVHLPIDFRLGW